ncbi:hypothetical protein EDD76_1152 [Kineothrix alysoides]|uniref:Uncharacterized protein n=1 Tax=Kineothrix alysoides TaxID=1469948 RepID=A0A4R1QX81_9FIRM|nr:hypothetical protein EDD76_1152 [Kineothrix alysoides]
MIYYILEAIKSSNGKEVIYLWQQMSKQCFTQGKTLAWSWDYGNGRNGLYGMEIIVDPILPQMQAVDYSGCSKITYYCYQRAEC